MFTHMQNLWIPSSYQIVHNVVYSGVGSGGGGCGGCSHLKILVTGAVPPYLKLWLPPRRAIVCPPERRRRRGTLRKAPWSLVSLFYMLAAHLLLCIFHPRSRVLVSQECTRIDLRDSEINFFSWGSMPPHPPSWRALRASSTPQPPFSKLSSYATAIKHSS